MRAVVNHTVLSNFALVRRPDLVRQSYDNIVVTPQVLAEFRAAERLRRLPVCDGSGLKASPLTRNERTLADRLSKTVDVGEASCLAVASTRKLIF